MCENFIGEHDQDKFASSYDFQSDRRARAAAAIDSIRGVCCKVSVEKDQAKLENSWAPNSAIVAIAAAAVAFSSGTSKKRRLAIDQAEVDSSCGLNGNTDPLVLPSARSARDCEDIASRRGAWQTTRVAKAQTVLARFLAANSSMVAIAAAAIAAKRLSSRYCREANDDEVLANSRGLKDEMRAIAAAEIDLSRGGFCTAH